MQSLIKEKFDKDDAKNVTREKNVLNLLCLNELFAIS